MIDLLKRLRIPIAVIAGLAVIAFTMSRYTSIAWLAQNDARLRDGISQYPMTSFFLAFVIYLMLSLLPGLAGKSIVCGWLFGMLGGILIVNFALVAAAIISFVLCRHYLSDVIQSRFALYLQPIQARMKTDGAWYLLLLRFAHAPFSFTNYAAGAGTEVPLRTFWWTTQLGLLPGNIVFVYAGARLPTLEELIRVGPLGLLDGPMIAALLSTVICPVCFRTLLQRWRGKGSTAACAKRKMARRLP